MDIFIRALIDILEIVFAVGVVGSAIVLVLSAFEDTRSILEHEEAAPDQPPAS